MNVGKAKAFGYGNITVTLDEIRLYDLKKAYSLDELCLNPWEKNSVDVNMLIERYKEKLADFLHVKNVTDNKTINTFLSMKDGTKLPDAKDIRFMDINAREYQNRKPLATAMEVLRKQNTAE